MNKFKRVLSRALAMGLVTVLMLPQSAYGAPSFKVDKMFGIINGKSPQSGGKVEEPPEKAARDVLDLENDIYVPLAAQGLPLKKVETYINANTPLKTHFEGSKKIKVEFKVQGVILSAESDSPDLEARCREDYLNIENVNMIPGDKTTVTVTAKISGKPDVVQKITVAATDGSELHPHVIANADDFASIKSLGLDKNYYQSASIDMSRVTDYKAIGEEFAPFMGEYDAKGFKLKNFRPKTIDSDSPAVFGYTRNAEITGLNIEGSYNTILFPKHQYGTIIGIMDGGLLENSSFTGDMDLGSGMKTAGGLVAQARNNAKISSCSFTGKIKGDNNNSIIGGIVGLNAASIENCRVKCDFVSNSEKDIVGGIAGENRGTISKCKAEVNIEKYGKNGELGGIAGTNGSEVLNCEYTGKIHYMGDETYAGGISARNTGTLSGNKSNLTATFRGNRSFIGGAVGRNEQGEVSRSQTKVNLDGSGDYTYAGGVAGQNYTLLNNDAVQRNVKISSVISDSFAEGAIKLTGLNAFAGGIAGSNSGEMTASTKTENLAETVINNCSAELTSIDSPKANRITGANTLLKMTEFPEKVHNVSLSNNEAAKSMKINGAVVDEKLTGENTVNGRSTAAYAE